MPPLSMVCGRYCSHLRRTNITRSSSARHGRQLIAWLAPGMVHEPSSGSRARGRFQVPRTSPRIWSVQQLGRSSRAGAAPAPLGGGAKVPSPWWVSVKGIHQLRVLAFSVTGRVRGVGIWHRVIASNRAVFSKSLLGLVSIGGDTSSGRRIGRRDGRVCDRE